MPKLSPAPPAQSNARKRKVSRSKSHSKKNRKKRRQEAPPKDADAIPARKNPATRFVPAVLRSRLHFPCKMTHLLRQRHMSAFWTPARKEKAAWSLKELVDLGFSLISAEPQGCANLIRETRPDASFTGKGIDNRRGNFGNLNAGVAHGGGRTRPANVVNEEANAAVIDTLINSAPFQRLSGYATGIFKSWAPRLYEYCSVQFERLLSSDDSLIRIFDNSAMAAAAFNFGPRTVCLPHIDFGNLPFSGVGYGVLVGLIGEKEVTWCCGTSSSSLSFLQAQLLRFPQAFVDTATRYSSGGNFRWVDHGFQTEEKYRASMTAKEAEDERIRKKGRWKMGLNLFSTLDELGLHT
ncbi:hypothetical protein BDP27DRAFT_1358359 [Rhodocollybia butyracea]|uniref:Uncharacterized protein n=1 Tax=Rhodocollybia butyracea TaxID=206335 RepID=A0A9P5Q8L5_9AGAR|nr:hypothetical protein BDP27DRAFT_1358359 [Rhodocollybia butyracea]